MFCYYPLIFLCQEFSSKSRASATDWCSPELPKKPFSNETHTCQGAVETGIIGGLGARPEQSNIFEEALRSSRLVRMAHARGGSAVRCSTRPPLCKGVSQPLSHLVLRASALQREGSVPCGKLQRGDCRFFSQKHHDVSFWF